MSAHTSSGTDALVASASGSARHQPQESRQQPDRREPRAGESDGDDQEDEIVLPKNGRQGDGGRDRARERSRRSSASRANRTHPGGERRRRASDAASPRTVPDPARPSTADEREAPRGLHVRQLPEESG